MTRFFASQKAAGLGVLVRDAEGKVVGACSKKIMALLGAVETEAKAFEFGLQFARIAGACECPEGNLASSGLDRCGVQLSISF
nr:hypothetical protein CFP56_38537 [Quercus suber]